MPAAGAGWDQLWGYLLMTPAHCSSQGNEVTPGAADPVERGRQGLSAGAERFITGSLHLQVVMGYRILKIPANNDWEAAVHITYPFTRNLTPVHDRDDYSSPFPDIDMGIQGV